MRHYVRRSSRREHISKKKERKGEMVIFICTVVDFLTFSLFQNEESKRLNDELTQARKETDRVRLDRAETVNRLTKSLEQSQRQNEELLRAGWAIVTLRYCTITEYKNLFLYIQRCRGIHIIKVLNSLSILLKEKITRVFGESKFSKLQTEMIIS